MSDEARLDETRLRELFQALARKEVAYAVFGAVALGLHGLARATGDVDLFVEPTTRNIERLKAALREVFDDPQIDEISPQDLCGEYPAVRYLPPEGFGFDILTRLGEAFHYATLEIEEKAFADVTVRVVSARTLWEMKKDTVRPMDRFDAALLAEGSASRKADVPVRRYRSVEEMPPPWRDADDPANLRLVASMLSLYRRFDPSPRAPGVRRFRSVEEASEERGDPYRRARPERATRVEGPEPERP